MVKEKRCPTCGARVIGDRKYHSDKCSRKAVKDSINQLRNKKGPIYEKWKRKLKASLSRV